MIDVSCIIINYNTATYTLNAVKSILEFHDDSGSMEIIAVDNCSEIDDYLQLKKHITALNNPCIKLFRSKINTGFGGGNMYGVQHARKSKYYAFINNDTLQVSKNCLWQLQTFMESKPKAAVCSPQMLDQHHNFSVTIDHFSSLKREILRRALLEKVNPKKYLNRKKIYKKPTQVHYVQGAFLFVNARDFDEIGGFDTNLFLYYEESDLCLRLLKEKQKHAYLIPQLQYIHYKSASTRKNINIKIEQKIALLYHTQKHYGWFQHKVLIFHLCIRYFFSSLIKPTYWKLFAVLFTGAPLSKSLKQKQQITELNP